MGKLRTNKSIIAVCALSLFLLLILNLNEKYTHSSTKDAKDAQVKGQFIFTNQVKHLRRPLDSSSEEFENRFSLAYNSSGKVESRREFIQKTSAAALFVSFFPASALNNAQTSPQEQISKPNIVPLISKWLIQNVAPDTGVILSFKVPDYLASDIWKQTLGESEGGIHERMVLSEGLIIYDGAVAQIFQALTGNLGPAKVLARVLWNGYLGQLNSLHGSESPFIYSDKGEISYEEGKRGFRFKVINAYGHWQLIDRYTGKTITWSQWQPIAGENAWAGVLGPLEVYIKEHGSTYKPDVLEMRLAEEVARAAIVLQAENGGIRMAPKGTWSPQEPGTDPSEYEWLYNEISTENNLSWYAAFRKLAQITGKSIYKNALNGVENYLKNSFDSQRGIFVQGKHYDKAKRIWRINPIFATDCQTWAIDVLGPEVIDKWFGAGSAYRLWSKTKDLAGIYDRNNLIAVDFTERKQVKSIEWTAGGIMASAILADYYENNTPKQAIECGNDAISMYAHMQNMAVKTGETLAWPYSDKRAPTGHGWMAAGRVLSTASTAWMGLLELSRNPFFLGGRQIPYLEKVTRTAGQNIIDKRTQPSTQPKSEEKTKETTPETGEDIWQHGVPGQYSDDSWKSKAIWSDFAPPIALQGGQTLLIEFEIRGSDVMGIQLKPVGESESVEGDMIRVQGIRNKKSIVITVPSTRKVWRIVFQIGENAWGSLGGSQNAILLIESIKPIKSGKPTGMLLEKKDIHLTQPDDIVPAGTIFGSNMSTQPSRGEFLSNIGKGFFYIGTSL